MVTHRTDISQDEAKIVSVRAAAFAFRVSR